MLAGVFGIIVVRVALMGPAHLGTVGARYAAAGGLFAQGAESAGDLSS